MDKIIEFININIIPYISSHGGDIDIIEYDKALSKLRLRLRGQCSTCPLNFETIEQVIKKSIHENFKNIKNIFVETGVSDEMLDYVKQYFKSKEELHGMDK